MKSRLSATLIILAVILGFSRLLLAGSTITQLTSNSYEDSLPRIGGHYVVWQEFVGGDWEILLYDIATGMTRSITDNGFDDVAPQTDGYYVTWQGFKDGEWDIFIWDGGEPLPISSRAAEDVSPQIANGFIVWTSKPFGDDFVGPGEIILYEAGSGFHATLSAAVDPGNALDDSEPRITSDVVIWVQTDAQDNTALYMYELSTQTLIQNPDYVWRDNSHTDGNIRVLTRHDGHDRELFVYDGGTRGYHQITNNRLQDRYPSISANHVVWMAGEGEASEIYLAFYEPEVADADTDAEDAEPDTATGGDVDRGDDDGGVERGDGGGGGCLIDTAAISFRDSGRIDSSLPLLH